VNLASRIRNDLCAQLVSKTISVPLTMDGLSQHYGVSYTPIRQALSGLIEKGLIRKKSNGRLEPVKTEAGKDLMTLPFESTEDNDPVEKITEGLVHLSLSGKETFVREETTARKYGLSRSTLRQVLQRLAGQGLLFHVPRRGWLVKPFRQEDLEAFIEVREVLEIKALDLAKSKLKAPEAKKKLKEIRNGNQILKGGGVEIDNSLHAFIVSLANNSYIDDFLERHGKYFSILFDWEGKDKHAAEQAVEQHHRIIEALLKEDWELAAKELSAHLHTNHPVLQEIST